MLPRPLRARVPGRHAAGGARPPRRDVATWHRETSCTAARRRVVRSGRWHAVRGCAALALALVVAVVLPYVQISDFAHGQRLRATQQHVLAPVDDVEVHDGKDAYVDVEVSVATGPAWIESHIDVDAPPQVGDQLLVVVDPDDPTYAVLADDDTTLSHALLDAGGTTALVVGIALFLGLGPVFPPLPALRAVLPGTGAPGAALARVRALPDARPRTGLYRLLHGSRDHDFLGVDLEVGGALLTGSFLSRDHLRPGTEVVLVGDVRPGGWCALRAQSTAWPATALVPTPVRGKGSVSVASRRVPPGL